MTHPKKWYIHVTEENHTELNRWRLSKRTSKASKWDYLFIPGTLLVSEHPYDGTYFFSNIGNFLKCHYQEISLEQFRQITNPNQTIMSKPIQISRELLNEYYNAATLEQRAYLTEHFKLDGTTTVEAIRGLHDMACEGWKPKIKKNHPKCFPGDSKYFDFSEHASCIISEDVCKALGLRKDFIQVRNSDDQELDKRSFYLSPTYNWELVQDGRATVLIPTKKSRN
jgi:hypothetical protein